MLFQKLVSFPWITRETKPYKSWENQDLNTQGSGWSVQRTWQSWQWCWSFCSVIDRAVRYRNSITLIAQEAKVFCKNRTSTFWTTCLAVREEVESAICLKTAASLIPNTCVNWKHCSWNSFYGAKNNGTCQQTIRGPFTGKGDSPPCCWALEIPSFTASQS